MAQANLAFSQTVTVTIHYSDNDLPSIITDESELTLRWWSGNGWQDVSTGCSSSSTYYRDIDQNVLRVPICPVGRYALFGPTNQLFLPTIIR